MRCLNVPLLSREGSWIHAPGQVFSGGDCLEAILFSQHGVLLVEMALLE